MAGASALCCRSGLAAIGRPTVAAVNFVSRRSFIFFETNVRLNFANYTVNQFSLDEVNRLGPDLACLQWLMNCGATSVKMSDGTTITSQRQMRTFIADIVANHQPDYKRIAAPKTELVSRTNTARQAAALSDVIFMERWPNVAPVFIDEVDATDAAMTDRGFAYFAECRQIQRLKMNFCDYIGDVALSELALGRPSRTLVDFEMTMNPRVTDSMTFWLTKLRRLTRLHLYFLPYVHNREGVLRELRTALPLCLVTFPETKYVGYGYEDADRRLNAYERKAEQQRARKEAKQT